MKFTKIFMSLVISVMMVALLVACGNTNNVVTETTAIESTTESVETTEIVTEEETTTEAETERTWPITVTDMSGNEVTIEHEVKTIINLWPAGTSSFFVMGAGDMLVGLAVNNSGTVNGWSKFFYPEADSIKDMGGITPTIEEIINLNPDLVIVHPMSVESGFAEEIRTAGIPAININFSDYETMIQAYTLLGEILGGEYQERLANWCTQVEAEIKEHKEKTADIAEEDRPVVYYISGQSDSLTTTMSAGSICQDWTESNGGIYAASALNLEGTEVTAEQIFELDPDVIIVGGIWQHKLVQELQSQDGWKELSAVKNGRVYTNPYGCFNWERFGLESLLQIDYAMYCIQPELAEEIGIDNDSLIENIISFYEMMNGTTLTKEQAQNMLDGLLPDGSETAVG